MADNGVGLTTSPVQDEEKLYRFVPNGKGLFYSDGRVLAQAFADSRFRPSVDRADQRGNDPRQSLKDDAGGILSFSALNVRKLEVPHLDQYQKLIRNHSTDIEPVHEVGNPSHAEIFLKPSCPSDNVFRRLRHALEYMVNEQIDDGANLWEIKPLGLRTS